MDPAELAAAAAAAKASSKKEMTPRDMVARYLEQGDLDKDGKLSQEILDDAEIAELTVGDDRFVIFIGLLGPIGSNGIIPVGPTVDYSRPHDRGRFAQSRMARSA